MGLRVVGGFVCSFLGLVFFLEILPLLAPGLKQQEQLEVTNGK